MHRAAAVLAVALLSCLSATAQTEDDLSSVERAAVAESFRRALPPSIAPETHECSIRNNLGCNNTVQDSISIFGCTTDSGNYFNVHRFFVGSNTRIQVTFRMASYTPLIVLTDEQATTTLTTATAGRGATATATFTVSTSGYYIAIVGATERVASGSYTITLTCTAVNTPPPTSCAAGPTTLCLNSSRFAVSVAWRDFDNRTGMGTAVPMTNDTGHFWFFSNSNVELVVKVLDGRALNNRFWVFYGSLTNVEYTITVRDTQTGISKTYFNPRGSFGSAGDVNAF